MLYTPTPTGEADYLRYISDALLEDLASHPNDEVIPEWIITADDSLHYIPMELHTKMSPPFYRGYVVVIEAMYQILVLDPLDATCIPTPAAITARIQEACRKAQEEPSSELPMTLSLQEVEGINTFFAAGGKVEFALEALTDRAMEKSPEGSEYRRKKDLQEDEEEFEREVRDLPMCMNDLNFALVRTKLGLEAQGIGPYWFFLTDSESDDDDDVEEDSEDGVVYVVQPTSRESAFMRRRE